MSQIEFLRRRLERERLARKQAEAIAEEKSRELFLRGQDLEKTLTEERKVRLENVRLLQEVQRLSVTDPLTGLRNRRGFLDEAQRILDIAIRNSHPLSFLMLDIDHFKRVNDTYGHVTGDKVLAGIASVCRNCMRTTDLLARLGGEEFCVLCSETTSQNALLLAERLRTAIAATEFAAEAQGFRVTVSIGISEYLCDRDSLEKLLSRSDEALYQAKNTGRNRVIIWKQAH